MSTDKLYLPLTIGDREAFKLLQTQGASSGGTVVLR